MNIATDGVKIDGSSSVPTLSTIAPDAPGALVPMAVPQLGQKNRVTGLSRSGRLKLEASPLT